MGKLMRRAQSYSLRSIKWNAVLNLLKKLYHDLKACPSSIFSTYTQA